MNESVWTVVFRGEGTSALRTSKQVRNELGQVERQSHRTGTSFRGAERDLSRLARGGIAGSGVFRGLGRSIAFASGTFLGGVGFIAVVRRALTGAIDLETQQKRSMIIFGASGRSIQDWARTTDRELGLAKTSALQAANAFGTMLTAMHLGPAAAAAYAKGITRVAAAISLARGEQDPGQAVQAITVGLAGRGGALRQYGIILDEANIKAEALRLGLVKSSVDTTKVTIAQNAYNVAVARYNDAVARYGSNTTQAVSARNAILSAEIRLKKETDGHAVALTNEQKAQAAANIIIQQGARFTSRYGELMNTTAGRQRRFHEGVAELQDELGQRLLPVFVRVLDRVNRYIETLNEGGSRHARFIRTLSQVGHTLHTTYDIALLLGRGLGYVARTMGGWQNAFKLVLGLVLVNKFLNLANAIRDSRLALVLLGSQAPKTAVAVEGAEAGMAASADVAATKVGRIRRNLILLARTAAIPIVVTLVLNEVIKRATGFDPLGRAWGSAGYGADNLSDARPVAGSKNPYPKGTALWDAWNLGYGDSKKRTRGQWAHGRTGKAYQQGWQAGHGVSGRRASGATDRAAFIAVQASRTPGHGSTSFHLPGERQPYDCSAFVQAVYRKAGIQIGGNTYAQVKQGRHVPANQMRPGDLIFMNFPGERSPGHVGIYVGGGYMVHDHGQSGGVDYQPVPWGNVVDTRSYTSGKGSGPISPGPSGGGTVGTTGGGVTVGHAARHHRPHRPHYVSESTRLAEALRIRSYERRIHQAERQDYITPQQERRDIARLERLRKLLASGHLTPTQMARIRAQVADLWRQINKQIEAGVTAARKKAERLAAAHRAAIEKAERIVQVKRDAFEKAWGRMADSALEAFDRITQAGEDAISKKYDAPTPAEAALNAIQQMQSQEDLAAGVSGAQSKLDLARRLGDPQMIAEAEKELRDAQRAVQMDGLEKQAAIEREAAEKRKQKELQEYDDARKIQRQKLEDMLGDLQKKLDEGTISWFNAQQQLKKILGDNLGPIGQLGALIGDTFTQALLDSVTGVGGAADALAKALQEVEKLGYRWNPDTGEWEKISLKAKPKPKPKPTPPPPPPRTRPPDEPTSGMAFGGIATRPVLRWVGERYRPEAVIPLRDARAREMLRSAIGGGGGDVHYHHYDISLPNYLGREQDVARAIRQEFQKFQRSGGVLPQGGRRRSLSSTTPFADRGLR